MVRAADAKEVGVGDPAEETCYNPDHRDRMGALRDCQHGDSLMTIFPRCLGKTDSVTIVGTLQVRFPEHFLAPASKSAPGLDEWGRCVCIRGP